jgi:hypothetical protein
MTLVLGILVLAMFVLAIVWLPSSGVITWVAVGALTGALSVPSVPGGVKLGIVALNVVAIMVIIRSSTRHASVPVPPVWMFYLPAVLVIAGLSERGDAGLSLATSTLATIAFPVLGGVLASKPKKQLPNAMIATLVVLVVIDIAVSGAAAAASTLNSTTFVARSGGPFTSAGGPNIAGTYCAAAMAACLGLVLVGRLTRRYAVFLVVVGAASAVALVLTLSRRSWLAALIAVGCQILVARGHFRSVLKPLVVLAAGAGVLLFLLPRLDVVRVVGRVTSAREGADFRAAEYHRFSAMPTWDKLFGGGISHSTYWLVDASGWHLVPVHSSYLFVALTTGLAGLGCLIAILVRTTRQLWVSATSADPVASALLGVFVVLLASSTAGEQLFLGPFSCPFWLIIGYAVGLRLRASSAEVARPDRVLQTT